MHFSMYLRSVFGVHCFLWIKVSIPLSNVDTACLPLSLSLSSSHPIDSWLNTLINTSHSSPVVSTLLFFCCDSGGSTLAIALFSFKIRTWLRPSICEHAQGKKPFLLPNQIEQVLFFFCDDIWWFGGDFAQQLRQACLAHIIGQCDFVFQIDLQQFGVAVRFFRYKIFDVFCGRWICVWKRKQMKIGGEEKKQWKNRNWFDEQNKTMHTWFFFLRCTQH